MAQTGAAVQAFENNNHLPNNEVGYDPYVAFVRRGLNFLLASTEKVDFPGDAADANGNGYGIACYNVTIQIPGTPDELRGGQTRRIARSESLEARHENLCRLKL